MKLKTLIHSALLLAAFPSRAAIFNTYAAWSDVAPMNRGYIYVYSGSAPADVELFKSDTPGVSINTSISNPGVVAAYEPILEYGPITMVSDQQYFRLQTNNPVVWEIEEDLQNAGDDSQDMLAAAA